MMHQSHYQFDSLPSNTYDAKSQTSTEGQQSDFHQDCLSYPHSLTPFRGGSTKAKSSLCKNFTEKGYCPYGTKCQFAHGPEQLRINMEHNRSYKTKGCHAFVKKGYCCYGSRCNFIHQSEEKSLDCSMKWSMIYANHRQTFRQMECDGVSKLMGLLGQ